MTWVAAQTALMAAIAASWFFPPWIRGTWPQVAGGVMLGAGVMLVASSRVAMGRSFTMWPNPREDGSLVTSGPFHLVRHPTYLGALLCFAGGSLFRGWVGLGLTGALAILWAAKARVEERYLSARFPGYADYRRRVRHRLVPFLY